MPRQKLKIVFTPPICRVHYQDLEAYLTQIYHFGSFNILKAAGVVNEIFPEYRIRGVIPPHLQDKAKRIRAGHAGRDLNLILAVLCSDGHIPAGHYVLDTHKRPKPIKIYEILLRRTLNPRHPECVRFRERHRGDRHFCKKVRIIDRSLVGWLGEEPEEPSEHIHDDP